MGKLGRAYGAVNQVRAKFDEATDDGTKPAHVPLDLIDRGEAEKRATKLIDAIGKGHAALVAGTLRLGFSRECWRILAALETQAGSVPLIAPRPSLVSQTSS
jgi:hypothetical protein